MQSSTWINELNVKKIAETIQITTRKSDEMLLWSWHTKELSKEETKPKCPKKDWQIWLSKMFEVVHGKNTVTNQY